MKNLNLKLKNGSVEEFFTESKKYAKKFDKKKVVSDSNIIIFEDPSELIKFLSPKKIALINTIKQHPLDTITNIAKYLNRDRASVSRDIKSMAEVGMVKVQTKSNSGHGLAKTVDLSFQNLTLQAIF